MCQCTSWPPALLILPFPPVGELRHQAEPARVRQAGNQRQVSWAEGLDLAEILGHPVPPHARFPLCSPEGYGAGTSAVTRHGHFAQLQPLTTRRARNRSSLARPYICPSAS